MTYLGDNKIHKFGNGNRLYLGDRLIYQLFVKSDVPIVPDEEYKLPDIPFLFNFNAKNYADGVIPNSEGALFEYDCTLSNTNVVEYYGDYLTFNGDANFSHNFGSSLNNPFNRSGNDPMTIICKSKIPTGTEQHILANRGSNYNWMVRIGDTFNNINQAWLHTLKSSAGNNMIRVPIDADVPNIVAFRCLNNGNGYAQNYTNGEIGVTTNTNWGGQSDEINLFYGGYFGEIFLGDFYWMYCSLEQLTDEQIQQVIAYNEDGKFTPPSVDDDGDDDIVIEGEWTTLTFDFDKSQVFQEVLIDMNNAMDDEPSYCFARFSMFQNGYYDNVYYSICVVEDSVHDNGDKFTITDLHNVGNNVYYYKFSNPIYVADIEENFNVSRIKIKIS